MNFNGKNIIDKYYEEAFSVYHYRKMKTFEKVFPEEYSIFYNTHFKKIKSELKNTILYELELLDDLCMYFELDRLIDNIPDLLKELGLCYTKEFGQKILFLCGREPISLSEKKGIDEKSSHDYIDREERALEFVKEDAANWLLGPSETYLEDEQIHEIISKSSLNPTIKASL